MSPKMGRPPKNGTPKNVGLQLRITEKTDHQLRECADLLNISRTEVIERSVEEFFNKVVKK